MSPGLASAKDVAELVVFRGSQRVGVLARTRTGARFTYDPDYAVEHRGAGSRAVAFRLPVRGEGYDHRGVNLHPFFAGLLPEGLRFKALVRGVKTSEDDLYSLLAAAGSDTVGDVHVHRPGAEPAAATPLVDTSQLAEHSFTELFERSLDWSERGDAVTVAGVQPKVSAAMISFPLRARNRRRAHLLKLAPPEFPKLVENEAFFMKLARSIGLPTAAVKLVHDREERAGLLVERFDRVPSAKDEPDSLIALHQEDACQLLDRYPADKYRLALREIGEALEVCSAPVVERLRLVQLQALSYLVANGDLHGKNISVLVADGRTRLAPVYDLLSTLPYGDAKLALPVEGKDENLRRADFVAFGERLGLRRPATERTLEALVKGVGKHLPVLPEIGLDERKTKHLERVLAERLAQLGK